MTPFQLHMKDKRRGGGETGETGECKHSHKAAFIYITVNNSLQFLHRLCLCMSNNVALNHSSQRGMTSLTASPSRIMISLYWGGGGILGYWECLCTTQDAVMMSLRDRQTVVWVRVQLEQQGVPTSNPDPLCHSSKHTHTPPPVYSILSCCRQTLQPHFRPLFPPFSQTDPPPDKQGTLIIPFPIINLCCFHTMGPEESCRQQRKHLLLSRQGTNSRILEAVSYIPPVKNTHRRMHTHTQHVCRHTDDYFLLSPVAFPHVL